VKSTCSPLLFSDRCSIRNHAASVPAYRQRVATVAVASAASPPSRSSIHLSHSPDRIHTWFLGPRESLSSRSLHPFLQRTRVSISRHRHGASVAQCRESETNCSRRNRLISRLSDQRTTVTKSATSAAVY